MKIEVSNNAALVGVAESVDDAIQLANSVARMTAADKRGLRTQLEAGQSCQFQDVRLVVLPGAGRPATVNGKKKMIYLDDEALAIAERLGGGNVSKGIRIALERCNGQD